MKRRDKTEILRDRLQLEDTRLLFQIDEAAEVIQQLSAGQIYSDSTVGISSAFDRYANTLAGNDKNAGDAAKAATSTDAQKTTASAGKNVAEAKKDKTRKRIR